MTEGTAERHNSIANGNNIAKSRRKSAFRFIEPGNSTLSIKVDGNSKHTDAKEDDGAIGSELKQIVMTKKENGIEKIGVKLHPAIDTSENAQRRTTQKIHHERHVHVPAKRRHFLHMDDPWTGENGLYHAEHYHHNDYIGHHIDHDWVDNTGFHPHVTDYDNPRDFWERWNDHVMSHESSYDHPRYHFHDHDYHDHPFDNGHDFVDHPYNSDYPHFNGPRYDSNYGSYFDMHNHALDFPHAYNYHPHYEPDHDHYWDDSYDHHHHFHPYHNDEVHNHGVEQALDHSSHPFDGPPYHDNVVSNLDLHSLGNVDELHNHPTGMLYNALNSIPHTYDHTYHDHYDHGPYPDDHSFYHDHSSYDLHYPHGHSPYGSYHSGYGLHDHDRDYDDHSHRHSYIDHNAFEHHDHHDHHPGMLFDHLLHQPVNLPDQSSVALPPDFQLLNEGSAVVGSGINLHGAGQADEYPIDVTKIRVRSHVHGPKLKIQPRKINDNKPDEQSKGHEKAYDVHIKNMKQKRFTRSIQNERIAKVSNFFYALRFW